MEKPKILVESTKIDNYGPFKLYELNNFDFEENPIYVLLDDKSFGEYLSEIKSDSKNFENCFEYVNIDNIIKKARLPGRCIISGNIIISIKVFKISFILFITPLIIID